MAKLTEKSVAICQRMTVHDVRGTNALQVPTSARSDGNIVSEKKGAVASSKKITPTTGRKERDNYG